MASRPDEDSGLRQERANLARESLIARREEVLTQRLIVAGHSHTLALIEGAERDVASGSFASLNASLEVSLLAKWRGAMVGARWSGSGFKRLAATSSLVDFVVGSEATHVALMWLGNQMSVRALQLNGAPFDVILPSEDRHDVDPSLQLIPYSVVRSYVAARLETNPALLCILDTLRDREVRVCLLGPPPPLPGPAARERLAQSPHFVAVMEQLNLNPTDARIVADPVRNRLRSVMLETYASFAASHGADFVPPPEEATDRAGMLAAPYWTDDATHGNSAYGALYMRRVLNWLGSWSDG